MAGEPSVDVHGAGYGKTQAGEGQSDGLDRGPSTRFERGWWRGDAHVLNAVANHGATDTWETEVDRTRQVGRKIPTTGEVIAEKEQRRRT